MTLVYVLLAFVAVQRLVELVHSRRNLATLDAQSPCADPPPLWRAMVLLHVVWLVAIGVEVFVHGRVAPVVLLVVGLVLFVVGQFLRVWAIRALGRFWNVRAVVDPATEVVTDGPYRYVRHPNYTGLLCELVGLPLAAGAWTTLALCVPLHLPILWLRIRHEEALLERVPGYGERMAGRGLLLPRLGAFARAKERSAT